MLKRFVVVLAVFALFGSLTFAAEVLRADGSKEPAPAGKRIQGPATVRTASGGRITIDEGGAVEILPPDGDIELIMVKRGAVRGIIDGKTQVAGPNAWLMVRPGTWARFYAETNGANKGFIKVTEGQALLVYGGNINVHLTAGNGINLAKTKSGGMWFGTHQTNVSDIRMIHRVTDTLEIDLTVPKATSGSFRQELDGQKTRVTSDAISWKSGQISLETRLDGEKKHTGSLGPGTFAVIDNSTGVLEISFSEADFQIVERAASLTSELSALAVSNFFGDEAPKSGN
ncbi:MAG: hypothetical protein ABFS86_04390 [Planctomycetota bacterium]